MPQSLAIPSSNPTLDVTAILGRPRGTMVVGPRPAPARRGMQLSWRTRVLHASSILAFSFLASTWGLEKSGLGQEAIGWISPVAQVASAPERVDWVELAPSPFLEAGWDSSGSFSVPQMLDAWRTAGMTSDQAQAALADVSLLRPVLLGRADPILEHQLQEDARAAAARLARDYPQAHAALLRRQAGMEGAATPLSLIDTLRWDLALPEMERAISQGERPPERLAVLLDRAHAWNDQNPDRALSISPYLMAGSKDGQWSLPSMIGTWKDAGMDPLAAQFVLEELVTSLPDLEGLPESLQAEKLFVAAMAFESLSRTDPDIQARLPSAAAGSRFPLPSPESDGMSKEEAAAFWQEALEFDARRLAPAPEVVSMDHARQLLAQAVRETGLRSVSLSLDQWHSPATVARAAWDLKRANAELQAATGWEGKVLGLDGRVELSLGKPVQISVAQGAATADETGRLQVVGQWGALGHEWFHAFDYVASRMVMTHSTRRPLSENIKPLRMVALPLVYDAMEQLMEATTSHAPEWAREREWATDQSDSHYWVSAVETLAFGFQGHLQHNFGAQVLVDEHESSATPAPAFFESQALASFYSQLFQEAKSLGLSGSAQPTLRMDPEKWRLQRAAAPEMASVSERRSTLR